MRRYFVSVRQSGKSPEITFNDRVSKGVVKWLQNCWKPFSFYLKRTDKNRICFCIGYD